MGRIAFFISIAIGVGILGYCLWRFATGKWSSFIFGWLMFFYGIYFSFFTGTCTSLIIPGIGSIGAGAATGGIVGLMFYGIIGTLGVVTGGAGFALGAFGMATIGVILGAIGAGSGGFGLRTTSYFLVTPYFWAPLIFFGFVLIIRGLTNRIKKG